jgi:hypothetical protein
MRRIRSTVVVLACTILLGSIRRLFPERLMSYSGSRAILDAAFALGLLGLILLLASGLGWKVLRRLRVRELTALEKAVFALPLGLGILAYGVLALGLLGLLDSWALLLWLLAVGILSWPEWSELLARLPSWMSRQLSGFGGLRWGEKAILLVGGLVLGLGLLNALTPPWDYDGLMYHLLAPRLFLQAGQILPLPDTWQANGPFTIEMLYTLGLAWESDTFAKLLHYSCALWLVLATFGFGQRHLGRAEAWLAVALLLGVPIFPNWAASAGADMAWALYEFLALYALMLWRERYQNHLLFLAALMVGFALGSKYLALGALGILGLWILWQGRGIGWGRAIRYGLAFGGLAILTALPWYAKNWLLVGNPLYPFLFGGLEWDAERLGHLMAYLQSFGVGRGFVDYLLLPWNLYAQNTQFGTLGIALEIPGLLLPAAILYPFGRRRKVLNAVACITGMRFIAWAMGSQQTRFLLPIFPALALLGASGLWSLIRRLQVRWKWAVVSTFLLVGVAVSATLLLQVIMFGVVQPTNVILGRQSKSEFLEQRLVDFCALQFVRNNLSPDERALMMWDGMGYYCDARCLPDADQSNWTRLIDTTSTPMETAARLQAKGVTHLLFNRREAEFFLHHDPSGQHEQAMGFFLREFLPSCTEVIYHDEKMLLAKISCP